MLKEVKNVSQHKDQPRRRWFEDDYFDLIVWFQPGEEIWGFQLCYDRERKPRALTWTRQYGYRHDGIDTGENLAGASKESPVLVADGLFEANPVADRLEAEAGELPAEVRDFILAKVREYRK